MLITCINFSFTEGSNNELKEHLIEELDYVLLPEEAWTKIHSWYGLQEGQVGDIMYYFVMQYFYFKCDSTFLFYKLFICHL